MFCPVPLHLPSNNPLIPLSQTEPYGRVQPRPAQFSDLFKFTACGSFCLCAGIDRHRRGGRQARPPDGSETQQHGIQLGNSGARGQSGNLGEELGLVSLERRGSGSEESELGTLFTTAESPSCFQAIPRPGLPTALHSPACL
ncbi:unnamed protein product [Pleuronectes platessa]|uniref:Uncharacterized protein n=1 Tax=Pleuronectes platessa TaxID=8262 RepID=A0A9N7V0B0_PLEPL|nr:unnamed protein product [Pleuronectes platessa]